MMPLGGSGGVNVTWIEVELTSIAISIRGAEGTVGNTEIQYIIIPDNNFAANLTYTSSIPTAIMLNFTSLLKVKFLICMNGTIWHLCSSFYLQPEIVPTSQINKTFHLTVYCIMETFGQH